MQDRSDCPAEHANDESWLMMLVRYVWHQRGIRVSLAIACLLLAWNFAVMGVLFILALWCPVWLFTSGLAVAVQLPGGWLVVFRVVAPPVVLGLVLAGSAFRIRRVETTATRIIAACEAFRAANARFPKALEELVPRYLRSAPRAGHRLFGCFVYVHRDGHPLLVWQIAPPCARKVYDFDERRRSYLD
jgi:hypothetical protein